MDSLLRCNGWDVAGWGMHVVVKLAACSAVT